MSLLYLDSINDLLLHLKAINLLTNLFLSHRFTPCVHLLKLVTGCNIPLFKVDLINLYLSQVLLGSLLKQTSLSVLQLQLLHPALQLSFFVKQTLQFVYRVLSVNLRVRYGSRTSYLCEKKRLMIRA